MPRDGRQPLNAARGGILLKFLVLLAALFAVGALAWMTLLPYVVTSQLRRLTGFDVAIETLMVNPFTGTIRARGLVVNNPPTFPRPEFLQVREFEAEADLVSLFTRRPVVDQLKLDIGLLALVKRANGRTNLEVFRGYLDAPPSPDRPMPAKPERSTGRAFTIRRLSVRFDRLVLADYSGAKPVVNDYPVKLDRTFTNVTDSRQLLLPDSLAQLFALGGAVGSLLPEDIGKVLDNALHSGRDLLQGVRRPDTEAFHGFSDALEESKKP